MSVIGPKRSLGLKDIDHKFTERAEGHVGMRTGLVFAILVAILLFVVPASARAENCDLAEIDHSRELHDILSRRAVEVVERASRGSWETDTRLVELVAPSALFSLGAGDVGRSAGTGPAGAHALALLMNADTFRFNGWDYMDGPVDACAVRRVEVEFVNTEGNTTARMEFTFEEGRVTGARGWHRTIQVGHLAKPEMQN